MLKFKHNIERLDTKEIVESDIIDWDYFKNKTILITGATGLIGTQIVKTFLYANNILNTNIKIIIAIRNRTKAKNIFYNSKLGYICQDITKQIKYRKKVDFIIHTANNTSSVNFVQKPVETIHSIIEGTKNVLDFARKKKVKSIVYLSSMEVYGEIPTTKEEALKESDYGYIDILKPRSSYQEGKKAAECLCSSYATEYNVPVKIARLSQTIGAGVDYNDNRVFAQFARNIVENQDIILKTKGETIRSYCYITDAITALLAILKDGEIGQSYNIANPETTCSIKEMAEMLCKKNQNSKLIIKEENDSSYLNTLKYYLDISKISSISKWKPRVNLQEAYSRLINGFYYEKEKLEKKQKEQTEKINAKRKQKYTWLEQIFSIKNNNYYKVLRILKIDFKKELNFFYKKFYNLPIETNKIVFSNFNGNGYGCNPKYIAEEIIRRKLPYKLIWLTKSNIDKKQFPTIIKTIKFSSKEAIKELATAKIWIDNQRKIPHIKKGLKKREEQIYIQTWHGSLGIKKIDADVPAFNNIENITWINNAKNDSSMIDFLLSNSTFENNIFKNGFWYDGEIKKTGHPRNDIFFYSDEEQNKIKKKIYNTFKIDKSKKLLIYVPSFRSNNRLDCYTLNTKEIKQTLEKKFGGSWCILIRLHPRIAKTSRLIFDYNDSIINASYYPDIQELLIASDIAITDYSSCIFDFMLSKKPAFIFTTDTEEYNNDRGFYYPLESTPFPVCRNNEELCKNIKNFDYKKYKIEVETFLKEKGCFEDGKASKRVVDLIEEIINEI